MNIAHPYRTHGGPEKTPARLSVMFGLLLLAAFPLAAAIHVAPTGSDANPGTIGLPLLTLAKAVTIAMPGDTILLRGGNHMTSVTINITRSGTADAPIHVFAYPGEHPVIDCSPMAEGDANRGIFLTGDHWYFKGIEIYKAGDNGVKVEGNYNTFEFCSFHHCGDSGLQIGMGKSDTNPGNIAGYNLVVNCDSYMNFDSRKNGGNADGFACKLHAGPGNVFRGCRSWENSDDGWDLYEDEEPVLIEDCWTWHNGDPASYGWTGSWSGNGNGFKIGGNSTYGAKHIVRRCVVFDHHYTDGNCKGFDQNDNNEALTLVHCLSFGNKYNYALNNDNGKTHVVMNCAGFGGVVKNFSLTSQTQQTTNSWNVAGVTVDSSDFQSLDVRLAKAPREADGSLPRNGFARLKPGSDLIDKGTNAGFPFSGSAPDLGPFEYFPASAIADNPSRPAAALVLAAYPNPFNPAATINVVSAAGGMLDLRVYDVLGREIAVLATGAVGPGARSFRWDGAGAASGIYVAIARIAGDRAMTRLVLVR